MRTPAASPKSEAIATSPTAAVATAVTNPPANVEPAPEPPAVEVLPADPAPVYAAAPTPTVVIQETVIATPTETGARSDYTAPDITLATFAAWPPTPTSAKSAPAQTSSTETAPATTTLAETTSEETTREETTPKAPLSLPTTTRNKHGKDHHSASATPTTREPVTTTKAEPTFAPVITITIQIIPDNRGQKHHH